MIFDAIINGFFGLLNAIVDLLPSIPSAPSADFSVVKTIIETSGYFLPMTSMIATFLLTILIRNWQIALDVGSWIWEKIPFN